MRTNIDIDDQLMETAREVTGLDTKKEIVETALRQLVADRQQLAIRELRGQYRWEGDIDDMR